MPWRREDDPTLCQCGARTLSVEMIFVQPIRRPNDPLVAVRWCKRCRTLPGRWVRFRPVEEAQ